MFYIVKLCIAKLIQNMFVFIQKSRLQVNSTIQYNTIVLS